jgi:hypothetical protein
MKQLILIIVLSQFMALKAQLPMPGGVANPHIWEITENNLSGQALWKSKLTNTPDTGLTITGKSKSINNNAALYFDAGKITNTLDLGKLETFSLFTICQDEDTLSENVIVSLENDTTPEMVLTNRRMAALDIYRYANYSKNKSLFPKIYSYSQNKSKDSATISRKLQLGRPPHNQNLPISVYKGFIPELILFNRYLSFRDRQKVESYLALKYGISLNQDLPVSYLNSRGEIIWDADVNAAYAQNISGIGKDDASGMYQKVSESVQTPGVMKIGIRNEFKNNAFMIWGDNGRPLRFAGQSGIRPMQCEWNITAFNSPGDSVYAKTEVLSLSEINPLNTGETYWMMIDRSGTGKYPFRQTDFVQCQPMTSDRGTIYFKKIAIDTDSSGRDLFTLLAAPAFFTRSTTVLPSCTNTRSGSIQTDIAGGTPPYNLFLGGVSNPGTHQYSKENNIYHIFQGIGQGSYTLRAIDANNNSSTEEIWVSNTHLWETKLNQSYNLPEGETLTLDASKGMPAVNYTYAWTYPDGSVLNNETINITLPGKYLLSITDENSCNSILGIKVEQTVKTDFRHVELFPNPARGWFAVRIDLEHTADVNVSISNMSGRVIKQTKLQNNCFYWYSDEISQSGVYLISLYTGNEKETLKLVVQ